MLKAAATTALFLAAATPAAAQSALLESLARTQTEEAVPMHFVIRSWTIAEAAAAREQLADDILVIGRIVALQHRLLEVNVLRLAIGAPPLLLPPNICAASPLGAMCERLPSTFASATSGDHP